MKSLKFVISILFIFLWLQVFGQKTTAPSSIHKIIQEQTDLIFDSLVKTRRDFHRYPELSDKEKRTSEKIANYLKGLDLEVKTNIGGYGVVGILKGAKKGKHIIWRADIDAIPSNLPDVVDFPSKNKGIRHICGHDVHTTIGLGIANVLAKIKEDLKGTIYFVFQPSEENFKGAKAMIADGLFDLIKADEIYGLHMAPIPVGTIATKPKVIYAHTNKIEVTYKKEIDQEHAIAYTKNTIQSFQDVVIDSKFEDLYSMFDPKIGITSPKTIFKEFLSCDSDFEIKETETHFTIGNLLNSSSKKRLDTVLVNLRQKIANSKYGKAMVSTSYTFVKKVPLNDTHLSFKSIESISNIYGSKYVIPLHGIVPGYFGDDFAYFQDHVPGVYFFLGGSNAEKEIFSMPHTPDFAVDEHSIKIGVQYFSSLIIERLEDQSISQSE